MKQKRSEIFETNSSSSHVFSLSNEHIDDSKMEEIKKILTKWFFEEESIANVSDITVKTYLFRYSELSIGRGEIVLKSPIDKLNFRIQNIIFSFIEYAPGNNSNLWSQALYDIASSISGDDAIRTTDKDNLLLSLSPGYKTIMHNLNRIFNNVFNDVSNARYKNYGLKLLGTGVLIENVMDDMTPFDGCDGMLFSNDSEYEDVTIPEIDSHTIDNIIKNILDPEGEVRIFIRESDDPKKLCKISFEVNRYA